MKTVHVILFISFVSSLIPNSAFADWSCSLGDTYFTIHIDPTTNTGSAEIGGFEYFGQGRRSVPLPKRLFGPVDVRVTQEGSHQRIEGSGFRVLIKPSPLVANAFTAILQAPTAAGGVALGADYAYFCLD